MKRRFQQQVQSECQLLRKLTNKKYDEVPELDLSIFGDKRYFTAWKSPIKDVCFRAEVDKNSSRVDLGKCTEFTSKEYIWY